MFQDIPEPTTDIFREIAKDFQSPSEFITSNDIREIKFFSVLGKFPFHTITQLSNNQLFEINSTWSELLEYIISGKKSQSAIDSFLLMANSLEQQNKFDEEACIHNFITSQETICSWSHFRTGKILFDRNQFALALSHFETSYSQDPDFVWAWYYAAVINEKHEHLADAINCSRQIARISDPSAPKANIFAMRLLLKADWSAIHSQLLDAVLRIPSLSDEDVNSIFEAFAAVANRIDLSTDWKSVWRSLTEVYTYPINMIDGVRTWWPVLVLAALDAAEKSDPEANLIMQTAHEHLISSTDRHRTREFFLKFIHARAISFLQNLTFVPVSLWTDELSEVTVSFADICVSEFNEPAIADRLLDLVLHRASHLTQSVWFRSIRLEVFHRQGRNYEISNNFAPGSDNWSNGLSHAEPLFLEGISALLDKSPLRLIEIIGHLVVSLSSDHMSGPQRFAKLETKLNQLVDGAFDSCYQQLKASAGRAEIDGALRVWEAQLSGIAGIIKKIESLRHEACPPGVKRHRAKRRKVVIVTSPYIPQVRYYRAEQTQGLLDIGGVETELFDLSYETLKAIQMASMEAHCIVLQRQPANLITIRLIAWCRAMDVRIFYDIDDLIFNSEKFPADIGDYAGTITRETFIHMKFDGPFFRLALNLSDEIIVSTLPLGLEVSQVLDEPRPVHLRRNLPPQEKAFGGGRRVVESPGEIVIFYGSGTKAHKRYLGNVVMPAFQKILSANTRVKLKLIGNFGEIGELEGFEGQVEMLQPDMQFSTYLSELRNSDIAIAPLDITPVTDCKSELKWFEAAMLGVCSVVSPTQNYLDVLEESVHALFAESTEDWVHALQALIDDSALRLTLVENSLDLISKGYSQGDWSRNLMQALALDPPYQSQPVHPPTRVRTRLLLVNVFFWPQTVGGATRVVESYIDEMIRKYGDEYELFVLCTADTHSRTQDFDCEFYYYRSALVTRVNIPPRDWADERDDRIEALVDRHVRRFAIDVAHVHCIQVLTASVITALKRNNVRVMVFLHDAWWLSEHMFLVDHNGKAFLPAADSAELTTTFSRHRSQESALRRRRYLAGLLNRCDRVFAVSESFAKIYRTAGFDRVDVLENGVSAVSIQARTPRPEGRVRLGFIGGNADHKGYSLLRGAIGRGRFSQIELVIVEHNRGHGYERRGRIGTTPTRYVGKVPQNLVHELYGMFDVLVAPSIWPESYGLVVREARFAGIPVIVSDRGDLARGVEPGRDGWVVDVSDDRALFAVLAALDVEPTLADREPAFPDVVTVPECVAKLMARTADLMAS